MTDVRIRDVPDDVVSAIDAKAYRLALSFEPITEVPGHSRQSPR